jgi:hypothetical protein
LRSATLSSRHAESPCLILLAGVLDEAVKNSLEQLPVRDDTLSELAALKRDAKDFGWRQMAREREKRAKLELLYRIAKAHLPKLAISQQNLHSYADRAILYTVYDLRKLGAISAAAKKDRGTLRERWQADEYEAGW